MSKLKRMLLMTLIGIGAIFIMSASVFAAETSPQLQVDIENAINKAVDGYLQKVDVENVVNKVVDDTLKAHVDSVSRPEFEKLIKEKAPQVLSKYFVDLPATQSTKATTGLQTTLDTTLKNTTQNSNEEIKKHVKDYILSNLEAKIKQYNATIRSRYMEKEYQYNGPDDVASYSWVDRYVMSDGKYVAEYTLHVISDRKKEQILSTVGNQLNNINLGTSIVDKLFQYTDAVKFSTDATEYVEARILSYTNADALLKSVTDKVKITVDKELRGKITTGVKEYIGSNAGKSIFNEIKKTIYEYVDSKKTNEKTGLEILLETGFDSSASKTITSGIGDIVENALKNSLKPYIEKVATEKINEAITNISNEYVNAGPWNLMKEAVIHNLDEILASDNDDTYDLGGDRIRKNLANGLESYLNNKEKIDITKIINDAITTGNSANVEISTKALDYIPWVRDSETDTLQLANLTYTKYANYSIGQLVLEEAVNDGKNFMYSTIGDKVISAGKNAVNKYLNGSEGELVRKALVSDVNDMFEEKVAEPLLKKINDAIGAWVSNGVGTQITNDIQTVVSKYLENTKTVADFEKQTGIHLGITLKSVDYTKKGVIDGKISLEDLVNNKYLVGSQRGRIVVPRENAANPLDDATVELGSILQYKVVIEDSSARIVVNPYWTALTVLMRFFPNPYGASVGESLVGVGVGIAGLSRTIANYDVQSYEIDARTHESSVNGIKNLSPAEAYVLAHEKHTGFYPDRVQSAYYEVLKQIRGIEAENDEGIVDKDTYQTIVKALGLVDVITSINWTDTWNKIKDVKDAASLIRAIPTPLITSLLSMAGVSIYTIFPFINPDILTIASMLGLGMNQMVGLVQNGIADLIDFKPINGQQYIDNIKEFPSKFAKAVYDATVGKVEAFVNEIMEIPGRIKDIFTSAASNLKTSKDQVVNDLMTAKARYEDTLKEKDAIETKLASATGEEKIKLEEQKIAIEQRETQAGAELARATQAANLLNDNIISAKNLCDAQINAELLKYFPPETAEEMSRLYASQVELKRANGENYKAEDLLKTARLDPSVSPYLTSTREKIDATTVQQDIGLLARAGLTGNADQAYSVLMENNNIFDNAKAQADNKVLLNDPKYQTFINTNKNTQALIQLGNSVSVNMQGKSVSEFTAEVLRLRMQQPDFNEKVELDIISKAGEALGVKMIPQSYNQVINKSGMSEEAKQKALGITDQNAPNILQKLLNSNLINQGTFLGLMQMAIPMQNEVTLDYDTEDPSAAAEIADEAIHLEKALNDWNEFEKNHDGNNLVDITDYSKVKVSYKAKGNGDVEDDSILVGPFQIDYIRRTYNPISTAESEMVNIDIKADKLTDEIISYTGIVDAELYADDAKTIKIKEWDFVYPEKMRDCRDEGDTEYRFPYPNEVFYLKFPSQVNNTVSTLSRMTFTLAKMNAEGQTYTLKGGYDQLLWMTTGTPIPCPLMGKCIHGVWGGHIIGTNGWCPPIFCPIHGQFADSLASQVSNTVGGIISKAVGALDVTKISQMTLSKDQIKNIVNSIPKLGAKSGELSTAISAETSAEAVDKGTVPPAFPFTHMMGHFYFCFPIVLGSDLHAQNLEQIRYSKIITEYQEVEMNFGSAYKKDVVSQVYHSTDVNTTSIVKAPENQGNISIEQKSVPGNDGTPGVPFLDNYAGYPAWPGNYKPTDKSKDEYNTVYKDNPNYPDNPYYPDNKDYPDYPSYPYSTNLGLEYDANIAEYPYPISHPKEEKDYKNPVIPLTFHIEGNVWLDNPGGLEEEADGYMAANERGIPNVEVLLFRVQNNDDPQIAQGDYDNQSLDHNYFTKGYIAKTLTDKDGHYEFEYVRVGYYYYVVFLYDGLTYRSTKYIESEMQEYNGQSEFGIRAKLYKESPDGFVLASHALEDAGERDKFNDKFYNISENLATSSEDAKIKMEYQTWYTDNGAVSTLITTDKRGITLDEYKMPARTLMLDGNGVTYALDDMYYVDNDINDLMLFTDGSEIYTHTYNAMEHVNLGLIQREQGDMAVRTDLYQIITKFKNEKGEDNLKTYPYDERLNPEELRNALNVEYEHVFDIIERGNNYYNELKDRDIINPSEYSWRHDSQEIYGENVEQVTAVLSEKSELEVFLEYKIYIKNNGTLHTGKVIELENSFTEDLSYPVTNQNYDCIPMASWLETMKDGSEKEDRMQITWEYRGGMENNFYTIYTEDLKDIRIAPGEIIELHLILKVNKTDDRSLILDDDAQNNGNPQSVGGQGTGSGVPTPTQTNNGTNGNGNGTGGNGTSGNGTGGNGTGGNGTSGNGTGGNGTGGSGTSGNGTGGNGTGGSGTNGNGTGGNGGNAPIPEGSSASGKAIGGDGQPGPGVSGNPNDNGTSNGRDIKTCITEIHTYAYDEGLISKSSNPGSMKPGYSRTYSDSTDPAPLIRLLLDRNYVNGNEIRGYVWEDLITKMRNNNNQFEGDGRRSNTEPKISNVKVELIEVIQSKDQNGEIKEVEVLRKLPYDDGYTDYYLTGNSYKVPERNLKVGTNGATYTGKLNNINVEKGEYRITNLDAGTYKVKFTYGDYEQLSKDLKYNAQDYKSLALDTVYQQYDSPELELFILLDTSTSMQINNKENLMRQSVQKMISELYTNVQKAKIGVITFAEPEGQDAIHIGLTERGVNKAGEQKVLSVFDGNTNMFINKGQSLNKAINQALAEFELNDSKTDNKARAILILTDGHMSGVNASKIGKKMGEEIKDTNDDKNAIIKAQNEGVQVISVVASTDEWDKVVFEEKADSRKPEDSRPIDGTKLYNIRELNIEKYVSDIALEDILIKFKEVLPNITDAKDVETIYEIPRESKVGDIYSRERNIGYSSVMINENSEVLHIENIKALQDELANTTDKKKKEELQKEIDQRIRTLADNTKVTAITPARNILFTHSADRTQEVNLGLVERPQVDIKIREEVSRIVVTLASGEEIIDTAKDLTQNVQIIKKTYPDGIYSIYMDKEIMQGAKLDVEYKITITNNGQIDTLADYYTYDMFDAEQTRYYTRTVPIIIGTVNNYYTNLVFRPENNTNLEVERNDVSLQGVGLNGHNLTNAKALVNNGKTKTPSYTVPTTTLLEDGRADILSKTKVTWEEKQTIELNDLADKAIKDSKSKVVQTTSLRNRDTELFPNMSKEVLRDGQESTISIYVRYTKNISSNDSSDMLTYDNSTEIVERLSDVGRRDYSTKTGNYEPHDRKYTELDGAIAERVIILPPFGEDHSQYFVIAIVAVIIVGTGVVFIRKKIM